MNEETDSEKISWVYYPGLEHSIILKETGMVYSGNSDIIMPGQVYHYYKINICKIYSTQEKIIKTTHPIKIGNKNMLPGSK